MVNEPCDRLWEVDALREGRLSAPDAASFEVHRRTCVVCRTRFQEDERLCALGRALPIPELSELSARRVRARLLRTAAIPARFARYRPALLVAPLVLAAALAVSVLWLRGAHTTTRLAEELPLAGQVSPSPETRWTQHREGGIERVRLESGTLNIHVRPQSAGERFLVDLPDGELEVRGTTFQVTVREGLTRRVAVTEGHVVLRLHGMGKLRLYAGDEWPRVAPVEGPPSSPAAGGPEPNGAEPKARGPHAVEPRPRAAATTSAGDVAPPSTDGGESGYVAAMRLYREGAYDPAARAFHAFASSHSNAPEAEDAAFLEAVALARAGRRDAAALVAEHFLERYPASFHRKEAALLVARAARDRGECAAARAVLAPWLGDGRDLEAIHALGPCLKE